MLPSGNLINPNSILCKLLIWHIVVLFSSHPLQQQPSHTLLVILRNPSIILSDQLRLRLSNISIKEDILKAICVLKSMRNCKMSDRLKDSRILQRQRKMTNTKGFLKKMFVSILIVKLSHTENLFVFISDQ